MCEQKRYPVKSGMIFVPAREQLAGIVWTDSLKRRTRTATATKTSLISEFALPQIELIPSRLFRQMLANCFGVEL